MHKDHHPAAAPGSPVPSSGAALDMDAFWMPFTASRQFKSAPRLLAKAKTLAHKRGVTLRQVLVEALEDVLEQRGGRQPFRLRDASFGKDGLAEGLTESDWDRIRDLAYEGRGG